MSTKSVLAVPTNQKRFSRKWKSTPEDCFNPYRDYRQDIFSFSCLYQDVTHPVKEQGYSYNLKFKTKKMSSDH